MDWIKIEDKEPEDSEEILFIIGGSKAIHAGCWVVNGDTLPGNPINCYDELYKKSEVTHWIKIPNHPSA